MWHERILSGIVLQKKSIVTLQGSFVCFKWPASPQDTTGVLVMHDILPWDDVLHLFVHIDDLPKMWRLFNATVVGHYIQIQLLESRSKHALTIKLFWSTYPRAGGQAWHWPCLDIAFNKTETREYVPTKTGQNVGWIALISSHPRCDLWRDAGFPLREIRQL